MKIKRNIAFLLPSLKTGGGTRVFFELANKLVDDYEVAIVAPNNADEDNAFHLSEFVKVRKIGSYKKSKIGRLFNMLRVIAFLRRQKNVIVIYTDPITALLTILLKGKPIRFIQADDYSIFDDGYLIPNNYIRRLFKTIVRFTYKYKHEFIFNSKFTFNKFQEIAKRSDVDYKLVHPSINANVFFKNDAIKKTEISICLVGRIHPWKGFNDFVSAWKLLNKEIKNKVSSVYVISHDPIEDLCMPEFTIIKPSSDDEIAKIMNNSNIFISTSWWEGFGLPPLEAMACGCAVITTDSGGVNEYIMPDENSIKVPVNSPEAIKKALEFLILNKEKRDLLGENAIKTASNFSWQESAAQLKKVLEKI